MILDYTSHCRILIPPWSTPGSSFYPWRKYRRAVIRFLSTWSWLGRDWLSFPSWQIFSISLSLLSELGPRRSLAFSDFMRAARQKTRAIDDWIRQSAYKLLRVHGFAYSASDKRLLGGRNNRHLSDFQIPSLESIYCQLLWLIPNYLPPHRKRWMAHSLGARREWFRYSAIIPQKSLSTIARNDPSRFGSASVDKGAHSWSFISLQLDVDSLRGFDELEGGDALDLQ